MYVYYCIIIKLKLNYGSFKFQIFGIYVCIIISEVYIKKKISGFVVFGIYKGLLFICERIYIG